MRHCHSFSAVVYSYNLVDKAAFIDNNIVRYGKLRLAGGSCVPCVPAAVHHRFVPLSRSSLPVQLCEQHSQLVRLRPMQLSTNEKFRDIY